MRDQVPFHVDLVGAQGSRADLRSCGQSPLEIEFELLQKINDKYDGSRFLVENWGGHHWRCSLALSVPPCGSR